VGRMKSEKLARHLITGFSASLNAIAIAGAQAKDEVQGEIEV